MSATFRAFGAKGFAKGAARKLCEAVGLELNDDLLVQVDGKWGFYYVMEGDAQVPVGAPVAERINEPEAPVVETPEESPEESEDGDVAQAPSANMFAGMAGQLGSLSTSTPVAQAGAPRGNGGGYKIEKDRPEQNGIKRPSAGGLCRAVWDWCDEVRSSTGAPPVAKMVREVAPVKGWNWNNAMIEFYQWRKFNGITGRSKPVAPDLAQKAEAATA